jgi:predicted exporter
VLAASNVQLPFTIDTNLKDLTPALNDDPNTQRIIDQLSSNIEKRITLIIKSKDRNSIYEAEQELQQVIAKIPHIKASSLEQKNIISALETFKFNLLTESDKLLLKEDNNKIIETVEKKLYGLESGMSPMDFTEDPFYFYSNFLFETAEKITAEKNNNQPFSLIRLEIDNNAISLETQSKLNLKIESTILKISKKHNVDILKSGVFFFAAEAAKEAKKDIQLISTLSSIGVLFLLIITFRSVKPLLLTLTSICLGVIFATAVNLSIYGSIHILTIVFGASLIGIVVDYSIHYFYHQKKCAEDNKKLHNAMLLSLITSVVGYSALSLSSLPALEKIAIFSCAGIIMAWLSVIALASLFTIKPIHNTVLDAIPRLFVCRLSKSKPNTIFFYWLLSIIAMAGYLFISKHIISDDPRLFFNPSNNLLMQEQQANQLIDIFEPGQYLIAKGATTTDIYNSINNLNTLLEKNNSENPTFSIANILPSPQEQAENYQLQEILYSENGALSQLYNRLGIAKEYINDKQQEYKKSKDRILYPELFFKQINNTIPLWITIDNTIYSIILIKKGANSESIAIAAKTIPELTYINTLRDTAKALTKQRISASKLLLIAYFLVAILLVTYYRKLHAAKALIVPITASLTTLFILNSTGTPITLFTVMALFLILGLGMDYVIFITEINQASGPTQQSILLSTVTSLLSFGLLAFSSIPIAHSFGITLLLGSSINFLAAIFYGSLQNNLLRNKG